MMMEGRKADKKTWKAAAANAWAGARTTWLGSLTQTSNTPLGKRFREGLQRADADSDARPTGTSPLLSPSNSLPAHAIPGGQATCTGTASKTKQTAETGHMPVLKLCFLCRIERVHCVTVHYEENAP